MPPQGKIDAIAIIFDVGKSVSLPVTGNEFTFFEKSRNCISWILRRKIMSMSRDLICLLLSGTDEAGESIDNFDVQESKNFCLKFDFQLPSWDMLDYIDNEVKPKPYVSDWVGALAIAVKKFECLADEYNICSKTVVVLSDMHYTFSKSIDVLLTDVKEHNVEVTLIGPDYIYQKVDEPSAKKSRLERDIRILKNQERLSGEELVNIMWDRIGDLMRVSTFDSALRQLSSYTKKSVRATPWNCVMDIGDLKISIQIFKKIDCKDSFRPNFKSRIQGDEKNSTLREGSSTQSTFAETVRDAIMSYKHLDPNSLETKDISVEKDEIIAGFRYGTSIIPFSDEDKSVLGYKPGKKSFCVLGFTQIENIPYYILTGEGSYMVVPRDKDERAEVALSALIQAMSETKSVAIVRRVYSDDRGLALGVLYPVVEEADSDELNHKECLVFIELAFDEDIRKIRLPRLRRVKKRITPAQYEVIDGLIDEMNLMKVKSGVQGEVYEALDLYSRHEVRNQFFQHCIVEKALHPDKPLPKVLPDHCKRYIMQPDLVFTQFFDEKLAEQFPVKEKSQEPHSSAETAKEAKPTADFSTLYMFPTSKEKTADNCFKKLFELDRYPQPEDIRDLLRLSVGKFNFKQADVIKAFLHFTRAAREATIKNFTDDYNFWMRRLRVILGMEGELEILYWKGVLQGNLGLISSEEHSESYTKREDAEFFNNYLKPRKESDDEIWKRVEEEEEAINLLF